MNFNFKKERKIKPFLFLFLFFLILVLPQVSSQGQPPFESPVLGGLSFAPATFDVFTENTEYKVHVHVINLTEVQTIATTSCYIHLYNKTGSHLLQAPLTWDSNNLEFKIDIAAGNQTIGEYAYVLSCNNTNKQIHLVKGAYEVVGADKFTMDFDSFKFLVIILLISTGLIILGFAIKAAPLTILGTFGLYFVGLWILFNGIAGIRTLNYTLPIALIILGAAAYISIVSAHEIITDAD